MALTRSGRVGASLAPSADGGHCRSHFRLANQSRRTRRMPRHDFSQSCWPAAWLRHEGGQARKSVGCAEGLGLTRRVYEVGEQAVRGSSARRWERRDESACSASSIPVSAGFRARARRGATWSESSPRWSRRRGRAQLGDRKLDRAILGCTHFPWVEDIFAARLPAGARILSQPEVVAYSLEGYLARHPEYASKGDPDSVSRAASVFWPEAGRFERLDRS